MRKIAEHNNIFFSWIKWHYFLQAREIFIKWRNVLLFIVNYFSIPLLLRTYLSPWKMYRWSYGRGFYFERYFEVMVSNAFSRILGAIMRTFLIIAGVFSVFLTFICGMLALLFWMIIPLLIIVALLCLISI